MYAPARSTAAPAPVIAASAVILLLAACGGVALAKDNRTRDSGGTIIDVSAWRSMPAYEFLLNIVDLPGAFFTGGERRVRNNSVPQQRIWFDRGKGKISVEHVYVGIYNAYVTDRLKSREYPQKLLDRFSKSRGEAFVAEERRKVYRFSERAGWVVAGRGRNTGDVCIVARIGFLSDPAKTGARVDEHYDTSFSFTDCSGKRSIDDVVNWIEGAKIVEPSYNRGNRK